MPPATGFLPATSFAWSGLTGYGRNRRSHDPERIPSRAEASDPATPDLQRLRSLPSDSITRHRPEDACRPQAQLVRPRRRTSRHLHGRPALHRPPDPTREGHTATEKHRGCEVQIPAEQTATLRRACRAKGIIMTTAIQASAVVETAGSNPTSPATRFISWLFFNLRKYCPPPYTGPVHGASLRMLSVPLNVAARPPWAELVNTIHPMYRQSWAASESDMLFVRVPFVETAPPLEPYISSRGILDGRIKQRHGAVGVQRVVEMVHTLLRQLMVQVWSWTGVLHVGATHTEAYHAPRDVEAWLVALRGNLVRNLAPGEDVFAGSGSDC